MLRFWEILGKNWTFTLVSQSPAPGFQIWGAAFTHTLQTKEWKTLTIWEIRTSRSQAPKHTRHTTLPRESSRTRNVGDGRGWACLGLRTPAFDAMFPLIYPTSSQMSRKKVPIPYSSSSVKKEEWKTLTIWEIHRFLFVR